MDYFVIGDIHGNFNKFNELLEKYWNPDNEKLILLGDLIDRGKESCRVVQLALHLKNKYGAVILGGNHEEMFLDWLIDPVDDDFYYNLGGRETIHSFFESNITFQKSADFIAKELFKYYSDEIEFLQSLPSYFETEKYIFVHAGINLMYEDWKNSSNKDFKWIREPFIYGRNETGKTIVFGHTLTRNLNPDRSDEVWFSHCKSKIGIDGACGFGGSLHGLKIKDSNIEIYSV